MIEILYQVKQRFCFDIFAGQGSKTNYFFRIFGGQETRVSRLTVALFWQVIFWSFSDFPYMPLKKIAKNKAQLLCSKASQSMYPKWARLMSFNVRNCIKLCTKALYSLHYKMHGPLSCQATRLKKSEPFHSCLCACAFPFCSIFQPNTNRAVAHSKCYWYKRALIQPFVILNVNTLLFRSGKAE